MNGAERPTGGADRPANGAERLASGDRACVCGHPRSAHLHYRRGSDCAVCGPDVCPRYRPVRWWRRPAKPDDQQK